MQKKFPRLIRSQLMQSRRWRASGVETSELTPIPQHKKQTPPLGDGIAGWELVRALRSSDAEVVFVAKAMLLDGIRAH